MWFRRQHLQPQSLPWWGAFRDEELEEEYESLDEEEVMGYFIQLADGLAHVHSRHRSSANDLQMRHAAPTHCRPPSVIEHDRCFLRAAAASVLCLVSLLE